MINYGGCERTVIATTLAGNIVRNTAKQALFGTRIGRNIKELFDLGNYRLPAARAGYLGFLWGHGKFPISD
jgi:hypothetical protein